MVVTAVLLPIVLYSAAILIYKFYLFVAGLVSPENKEFMAFFGMLALAMGLAGGVIYACEQYEIKTMK
uniref:Uncharacterized protein n=1 Tax=Podoviridae sp. ct9A73 TaxID=2825225 RepID=A0A8S5UJY0_9CAUD|nr:MAG TPA: hypothetical protein [Podoviridae sp. ct9A73]